jgi:hypothetical protein
VLKTARPLPFIVLVPRTVVPSRNCTLPVGVGPPVTDATVAANEKGLPAVSWDAAAVRLVRVAVGDDATGEGVGVGTGVGVGVGVGVGGGVGVGLLTGVTATETGAETDPWFALSPR